MRVLDIDLDFFVTPVIHWPPDWERPPSHEYEVWEAEAVLAFLRERCSLTDKWPGFVTNTHDELFWRWRSAVDFGLLTTPFHVTHVDAHADLGLGDAGWAYLMTELVHKPPAERVNPRTGEQGLNEGNFLLFALACRWLSDLTYVYGEGGGDDELPYVLKDRKQGADALQLLGISARGKDLLLNGRKPEILLQEPEISYQSGRWEQFAADAPYDFILLDAFTSIYAG